MLDDPTIQEIVDAHQLYINPSLIIIRISYLNTVARIDPAFRILKLCLILAQYLCDKKKYEKQGDGIHRKRYQGWGRRQYAGEG